MQMPEAIGVGVSEGQLSQSQFAVSESAPLRAAVLTSLQLSNPSQEAEVLSGVLKITACYGQEKEVVIGQYSNLS